MCSRRALWRSPGSLPPCRLRVQTICHPGDPRHMDPRNQCMALDKCDLFNVTCWTLLASPKFHIHFIPGACRSRQAVPQPVCDCDNCGPQRSMRGSPGVPGTHWQSRAGREHFQDGTFTLSNVGTIGSTWAIPVVFPPQVRHPPGGPRRVIAMQFSVCGANHSWRWLPEIPCGIPQP